MKSYALMNSSETILRIATMIMSTLGARSTWNSEVRTIICIALMRPQRYCSAPALNKLTNMFAPRNDMIEFDATSVIFTTYFIISLSC